MWKENKNTINTASLGKKCSLLFILYLAPRGKRWRLEIISKLYLANNGEN